MLANGEHDIATLQEGDKKTPLPALGREYFSQPEVWTELPNGLTVSVREDRAFHVEVARADKTGFSLTWGPRVGRFRDTAPLQRCASATPPQDPGQVYVTGVYAALTTCYRLRGQPALIRTKGRRPGQREAFSMHLLEKDKRRFEALAMEAGLPLANLSWSRGPARQGAPDSLRVADILTETQTRYTFCFGAQNQQGTYYLKRPALPNLSAEGHFPGTREIEPEFMAWAQQVNAERERVISWPESSLGEAALGGLLHSERTALLKALRRYDYDPAEFKWEPTGSGGVMLKRTGNDYRLQIRRPDSEVEFFLMCPSAKATSREGRGVPVAQLPELFEEWVKAMRSEDEAANYVHLGTSEQRHLKVGLASFRLENIRAFEDLQWSCADTSQNTLLIIGQNGTGKTTLLRCLALLLLPRQIASSLLISPYCRLLRRGQKEGRVSAVFVTGDREVAGHMTIRAHGDGEEITNHWSDEPGDFQEVIRVYAYGIGRSYDAEGGPAKDSRVQAVNSLFHYSQPLVSPENVLLKLQALDHMEGSSGLLEQTLKRSLRALLQLAENFEFELKPTKGLFVITEHGQLPLSSWADGYRLSLMWILDLWNSALTLGDLKAAGNGLFSSPQGLLLLDEIEQHAHPKLQLHQILGLERALPNLFRVITTHSPLVTLGVPPSSVLVLRPEGNRVVQVTPPDYTRYNIDEIYRDGRLFNTEPQSPESEQKLVRWKALIEIPWDQRTPIHQAELDELSSWFANV